MLLKCSSKSLAMALWSWLGTRRMEIFALAFEGSTVLAPSPIYPPQMPLTSKVGRIPTLSMVV